MKKKIQIALALLLSLLLTACGESSTSEASSAPTKSTPAITETVSLEEDTISEEAIISIENVEYITTEFNRTIEVKFRNTSDISIEDVVLYVDLMDAEGDILETGLITYYSLLESGQAATETMWLVSDKNPSSIRIAKGHYCETGNDMPIEFNFDPHFTSEASFDTISEPEESIPDEGTVNSDEEDIIQGSIEQSFVEVSERVENGEFTFTPVDFVDYLAQAVSSDYFISAISYPNSDITGIAITNSNSDVLALYLLFDTEHNYLDPLTDDTTKVDCIGVMYYTDSKGALSEEDTYYSAALVCDPSFEYETFCSTLAKLKVFPGASAAWHSVEYSYDNMCLLYIRAMP